MFGYAEGELREQPLKSLYPTPAVMSLTGGKAKIVSAPGRDLGEMLP